MKHINYILTLSIFLFFFNTNNVFAHETDTIKCNLTAGNPTLYPTVGGGFVSGNNVFGDLEIAQKYGVDTIATDCAAADSAEMTEVVVWFGAKTLGSNDSVRVKVYSVNPLDGSPDQLLSTSFPLLVGNIDTSLTSDAFAVEFLLPSPLILIDSFFVSVVLPNPVNGDSVAVISNTDGEGLGKKLGWIKSSAGAWGNVETVRGLDIDFAIFPAIEEEEPLSVDEFRDISTQIKSYPNPVKESLTIELDLDQPSFSAELLISTIEGKIVERTDWNSREIQNNKKVIVTSNLPSGTYFYTILTAKSQGQGKFVVVH